MSRYNVQIEVEVLANSPNEAWELVAVPFHDGSMRQTQPLWLNPLVAEPELIEEETGSML